MKNRFSFIYVLIAGCMWGCMGLLVRPLNEIGFTTMELVAIRSFETLLIMTVIIAITSRSSFHIKIRDLWVFVGTGMLSVVFFNFCYFQTIMLTSLSVAAILLYTSPFFVMLMSRVVFKEKISVKKCIAMVMAFVGCACVTGIMSGQLTLSVTGILFGLMSGFGYALYSIFGKIAINKKYSSDTITLYTFLMASIGVLPFIKVRHIAQTFSENTNMIIYAFLLIIVVTVIPYLSYTKGLSKMESGKAAVIASIEPVAATLVGIIAFHEKVKLFTLLGIAIVLISIAVINLEGKKS